MAPDDTVQPRPPVTQAPSGPPGSEPSAEDKNAIVKLAGEGRFAEASVLAQNLVARYPAHAFGWKALGAMLNNMGRLAEAVAPMQKAAELSAADAGAFYNLGSTFQELGRLDEAEASYRQALRVRPDYVEAHNNLANTLYLLGRRDAAETGYREALRLKPDYVEAHNNLGNLLQEMGRPDEAEASYRHALRLAPDDAEMHHNLGNALKAMGRLREAEASYRQAVQLRPDFAEAYNHLGFVLQDLGRTPEGEGAFRQALHIDPACAEAHHNLGNCLLASRRFAEAEASYRRALHLKSDYAEAYCDLGAALHEMGRPAEAEASLRQALQVRPDYAAARWKLAMAQIPIMSGSREEAMAARARFSRELDELDAWFDAERSMTGHEAVGLSHPFYLVYQEENNRDLLSRYGRLCARLMKRWQDQQRLPWGRAASTGPVRVGVVSAHFYNNSVWTAIVRGWFQHLDRQRVELHAFYLGPNQDDETRIAASCCASFEQGRAGAAHWAKAIHDRQIDVLIYPEVGMDPVVIELASLRLAPIQVAAWGHPETTGLPTIDYYLSGECLEPANAQENYSERLVCLPHLGCCYHPAEVASTEPDLASLGIDPSLPLLLCPGLPFKYAPQHDHVFVDIARKLGRCQFVFFTSDPGLSEALRQRLRGVFAAAQLSFDEYCVFIPWQNKPAFYGLMKRADVFLDTIGFSGFNTAMQAVECGLPIVTREGRFMRGRLASGILRRMGMTELIAGTEPEYVDLAVRLARDAEFRRTIRQRMEALRPVLFDDVTSVHALEDFIIGAATEMRAARG